MPAMIRYIDHWATAAPGATEDSPHRESQFTLNLWRPNILPLMWCGRQRYPSDYGHGLRLECGGSSPGAAVVACWSM
ncbi:hypothetical protein TNCV_3000141 [Trichonephila clavipes]|nr:hypothetical protein TNCV_3000141 [Trichonephila clavipes]